MYVSTSLIEQARTADLFAFVLSRHGDLFTREGHSVYLTGNKSLYIKEGAYGYRDFSTGETGNAITFLTDHLGYGFQEAVLALCGSSVSEAYLPPSASSASSQVMRQIRLPEAAPPPHTRMYAFLMARGIPKFAVKQLVSAGLIYQSAGTNNIVFVNKERDYCELRGTYTFGRKPFHGCRKVKSDRFWYFQPASGKAEVAFVTEAAIDAISLCLLHRHRKMDVSGFVYISIGGVSNHAAICRIKRRIRTILAVDNDSAGEACRRKHNELESILPIHKDWNEDLQALIHTR